MTLITKEMITQEAMVHPNVVGGTRAPEGKYPWFAVLLGDDLCGASLIEPEILLTAGHCMEDFLDAEVAIGVIDRDADAIVYRTVVQALKHPDYDDDLTDNDFAVLKLDKPVTEITPVQINRNNTLPLDFEMVTAIGFGLTEEDGGEPAGLMEVDVPVVNHVICQALYHESGPVTESMFCAGMLQEGGKDTCNGDSGGPAITKDGIQVGITSWGDGCSRPLYPGVYAKVSNAIDFIQGSICALAEEYRPASCNAAAVEAMENEPH